MPISPQRLVLARRLIAVARRLVQAALSTSIPALVEKVKSFFTEDNLVLKVIPEGDLNRFKVIVGITDDFRETYDIHKARGFAEYVVDALKKDPTFTKMSSKFGVSGLSVYGGMEDMLGKGGNDQKISKLNKDMAEINKQIDALKKTQREAKQEYKESLQQQAEEFRNSNKNKNLSKEALEKAVLDDIERTLQISLEDPESAGGGRIGKVGKVGKGRKDVNVDDWIMRKVDEYIPDEEIHSKIQSLLKKSADISSKLDNLKVAPKILTKDLRSDASISFSMNIPDSMDNPRDLKDLRQLFLSVSFVIIDVVENEDMVKEMIENEIIFEENLEAPDLVPMSASSGLMDTPEEVQDFLDNDPDAIDFLTKHSGLVVPHITEDKRKKKWRVIYRTPEGKELRFDKKDIEKVVPAVEETATEEAVPEEEMSPGVEEEEGISDEDIPSEWASEESEEASEEESSEEEEIPAEEEASEEEEEAVEEETPPPPPARPRQLSLF